MIIVEYMDLFQSSIWTKNVLEFGHEGISQIHHIPHSSARGKILEVRAFRFITTQHVKSTANAVKHWAKSLHREN